MNHYLIWALYSSLRCRNNDNCKKRSHILKMPCLRHLSIGSNRCCPGFWNLALFYIISDEIKSFLMRKMRMYFMAIVRKKIYENKKTPLKKFSSHGVLSLTLKTALSSQPDFYWNPHPANLNFMSSLFTTQLCYYYFFSLSGMLNRYHLRIF